MTEATVTRMVDSLEAAQTKRFRWREAKSGFYAVDMQTGETHWMGDGVEMFCEPEGGDCLVPGTQRFYDAINGYFENEQADVAMQNFGLLVTEEEP